MKKSVAFKHILGKVIFSSRWLQAPLYVGLIFALSAYVYRFLFELFQVTHLSSPLDHELNDFCRFWGVHILRMKLKSEGSELSLCVLFFNGFNNISTCQSDDLAFVGGE